MLVPWLMLNVRCLWLDGHTVCAIARSRAVRRAKKWEMIFLRVVSITLPQLPGNSSVQCDREETPKRKEVCTTRTRADADI